MLSKERNEYPDTSVPSRSVGRIRRVSTHTRQCKMSDVRKGRRKSHKLGGEKRKLLVGEISKDVTKEVNYSGPEEHSQECKKLPGDLAYFCD